MGSGGEIWGGGKFKGLPPCSVDFSGLSDDLSDRETPVYIEKLAAYCYKLGKDKKLNHGHVWTMCVEPMIIAAIRIPVKIYSKTWLTRNKEGWFDLKRWMILGLISFGGFGSIR